jgi:two-component system sensor histidine kinase DegS
MSSGSKGSASGLSRRYVVALRKQLALKPGTSLRPAENLGREALALGLDTLDLISIHEQAVIRLLPPGPTSRSGDEMLKHAASFFAKALTPVGNGHRSALKSSSRFNRLNVTLRQRTAELTVALRQLRREIRRREAVQGALKKSERHYGELLEKSRHMQEHLRRLTHELLSSQEEERKKISRELHDEIGQILTAINVRLATLTKEATVNNTGLKGKIASTQRLVERSMNTVHRFARELRPPLLDDLGLIPALHSYMKGFTRRTHIPVDFTASASIEHLTSDKRTVLYRVAQEAFTNVEKHAGASKVTVGIRKVQDVVQMEIHDNGKSFRVERFLVAKRVGRLGLIGMRERVEMVGGSFTVESAPGKGTTIRAKIPYNNGRKGSPNAQVESMK